MATDLAPIVDADTVARVLLHGDLKQLTPSQKISYYKSVCESVGLNPLTQPFQYLVLNGKEILYARREATEQLRKLHRVSITIVAREVNEDCYIVTARATLPDGRSDENIGAVPLGGLKGEARANAMMKSETKAKRRVTLAICGLGMLDETEVESIPLPQPHDRVGPALKKIDPAKYPPPPDPTPEHVAAVEEAMVLHADLPPGFVRVMHINTGPTKNPSVTKYFITFSNGEEVTTINSWLASLAENYKDANTPVRIKTRTGRYGTDLMALMTGAEGDPPEPAPPDKDLPF